MKTFLLLKHPFTIFFIILFLSGCIRAWDVRGVWDINLKWNNSKRFASYGAEFEGGKESGIVRTYVDFLGEYTVTGPEKMTFIIYTNLHTVTYNAVKQDENDARGSVENEMGETGTFIMVKRY